MENGKWKMGNVGNGCIPSDSESIQKFPANHFIKILSKTDITIILLILFSIIFSLLFSFKRKANSNELIIYLNNSFFIEHSLHKDAEININDLATLEIKDNKARMSHSNCKNQDCVIQGWSNNQPIICLPNRILIEFKNQKRDKDFLFITQ